MGSHVVTLRPVFGAHRRLVFRRIGEGTDAYNVWIGDRCIGIVRRATPRSWRADGVRNTAYPTRLAAGSRLATDFERRNT